ncbi:MAG: hypothetical protein ACR2KJ_15540 [Jatrophihabitans sp.]
MDAEFAPCPECGVVVIVEVPPCTDHNLADCPDRACTQCGAALVIDPFPLIAEMTRRRSPARARSAA